MSKFKTIDFYAHTSDRFDAVFTTDEGKQYDKQDYPPDFLGACNNDAVKLEIDLETGQILNWEKPTDEEIEEWLGYSMEEEFKEEC